MAADELVVHGAREHNLKDITVRLPRNRLICITGLSGSGKSSLAFDTIYAEGQRRYVESLSAYARQFLQMMEKPDVDHIDGLSPAISIDQKTTSRNPRSTVGTVTEIYDYLRLLYARVGRPHCPICGKPIAGQCARRDRRPGAEARGGDALHGQRAGRPRPQGRVQGRLRGSDARGLHARQGRRRAVRPRGGRARARQEVQAHDRGRRRPARDARRPAAAPHAVDRDRGRARRRARGGRPRRDRRAAALLRELRLPRPRRLAARAPAADLLLQRAARRLPALHRPRLAAGDRPGPARPRSVALDRRRRARAVVGRRLVGLLRGRDPGDRRPLRDRHVEAVGRADRGGAEPLPQRHRRREDLRPVPQPHGAAAPVHARLRRHRREPPAALPRDRLVAPRASGSRSTCRCARARSARARASSPRCSRSPSASARSTSSRRCRSRGRSVSSTSST